MTGMLPALALLPNALFSSLLMSVSFGFLGSFLVLRRQAFLADTLAHASLLGVALGAVLGVAPQSVLIPFSVILGVLLTWLSLRHNGDSVVVSAVVFSGCTGLGAILLGLRGIGGQEFVHILFGDLLWVTLSDLILFFVVTVAVTAFLVWNKAKLTLLMLNREMAITSGIRPERYEYGFSVCVALLIGVSIKLVGVFLVTALVAVPPLIAVCFARSFRQQLWLSMSTSLLLTLLGFFVALQWDLPFGPAISALLGCTAVLCQILTRKR